MEAIVLPKVTSELPTHPVHFDAKWKHLELQVTSICCWGLKSSAAQCSTAGGSVLLAHHQHLRRVFGWVLVGTVHSKYTTTN